MTDLDLFDTGHVRRMTHHNAMRTEVDAAQRILKVCGRLHSEVMGAFIAHGPMTDKELERLPQFAHLSPSTARKRRSELYQAGKLIATDERREGLTVWRPA